VSKQEGVIEMEGEITAAHPSALFNVMLDNGHEIIAHLAGKIRKNQIRVLIGDRVIVELSPYDLSKGRITYRYR